MGSYEEKRKNAFIKKWPRVIPSVEGPRMSEIQKPAIALCNYFTFWLWPPFPWSIKGQSLVRSGWEGRVWRWEVAGLNACWVWVHYMDKSKKKVNITWNPLPTLFLGEYPLSSVSPTPSYILKAILSGVWSASWCGDLRKTHHFCGISAKKAEPAEETSDKPKLKTSLQNWPRLIKNVSVIKDNERRRKCSQLKEMKQTWQPNRLHGLGLAPGSEGHCYIGHYRSISWNLDLAWGLHNNNGKFPGLIIVVV